MDNISKVITENMLTLSSPNSVSHKMLPNRYQKLLLPVVRLGVYLRTPYVYFLGSDLEMSILNRLTRLRLHLINFEYTTLRKQNLICNYSFILFDIMNCFIYWWSCKIDNFNEWGMEWLRLRLRLGKIVKDRQKVGRLWLSDNLN